MAIGDNIKRLREKNNMTQEKLADKLSLTSYAILKWETGENTPTIYEVQELSKIFHVSFAYLVDEETNIKDLMEFIGQQFEAAYDAIGRITDPDAELRRYQWLKGIKYEALEIQDWILQNMEEAGELYPMQKELSDMANQITIKLDPKKQS